MDPIKPIPVYANVVDATANNPSTPAWFQFTSPYWVYWLIALAAAPITNETTIPTNNDIAKRPEGSHLLTGSFSQYAYKFIPPIVSRSK